MFKSRQKRQLLIVLATALLLVFHASYYWSNVIDDSYISFRYGLNLIEGEGLVFNPGERVEGFSNFLWTVIAAVNMALGLDPMRASAVLGLLATLGTLAVTHRLLRRDTHGAAACVAGLALFALSPPIAFWAVQGMETPLFGFLLCLAFWRYTEELEAGEKRMIPWSGLIFALACLTRPEGPLYVLVFAGYRLARHGLRLHWSRLRRDLAWLALAVLPLGAYLSWRLAYYGEWLPNPYFAKTTAGASLFSMAEHEAGIHYLSRYFLSGGMYPALLGLVGLAAALSRFNPRRILYLLWIACGAFFCYRSNGDWMTNFRFMIPAIPAVILLAATGLDRVKDLFSRGIPPARDTSSAGETTPEEPVKPDASPVPGRTLIRRAGAAMVLLVALGFGLADARAKRYFNDRTEYKDLLDTDRWLDGWFGGYDPYPLKTAMGFMERLRDGETAVYGDIGAAGFVNPRLNLIDTKGLADHHMARLMFNRPHRMKLSDHHRKKFLGRMFSARPEAIVAVLGGRDMHPMWQTEQFYFHPYFKGNYVRVETYAHRKRKEEHLYMRRDLARRRLPPAEIEAHFLRAIDLSPRTHELYFRLAELYQDHGRHGKQREMLETISKRFGRSPAIRTRLNRAQKD